MKTQILNKMHRSKAASLFAAIALLLALAGIAAAQTFTPIRPPSVPLITRSPYVSTWSNANTTVGNWPTFWNGNIKAITGMAYIDGSAYVFLGNPLSVPHTMTQNSLQITPTQSIYTFQGGGVTLTVNFLSPVEVSDMKRLSIPLAYITAQAQSSDGKSHTVSLYFDISGEWAHGSSSAQITWAPETISLAADGSGTPGSLMAWEVTPTTPSVLAETSEYPDWGTALLATSIQSGLTYQSAADATARGQFVSHGVLLNTNDTNYRAINNNYPVFAYSLNLGRVRTTLTTPWTLALGQVRDPAVSYQGQNVPPLWKTYFGTFQPMLAFSLNDYSGAHSRANALDSQITTAATAVGGMHYAGLCALALRQAFAGTELVDPTQMSPALVPALPDSDPWLFLKEISSDGNVSTIDVVYPSFVAFLYTNPELLRLMIDPLIYYPESGKWPQLYAEHDIGASYPNAAGHNDGAGENMPVEETSGLLILGAAYMRYTHTPANATAYAQEHYQIFKQWADYLLTVPTGVTAPNALDPQEQNQTDDFTGQIAHSVNLSLKGIIAVGAMGQIAAYAGNVSDAAYYSAQAQTLISQWVPSAQNSTSTQLLLQYQEPANAYSPDTTGEPDTAWSLKYNAFSDRLLGTNLIPTSVLTEEANFYKTKDETYGIPMDYRNRYAKDDEEMLTAGASDDPVLRQDIVDGEYAFANTTASRIPFTDWYYPDTDVAAGFQARPVIGGLYALLFQFTAGPTFSPSGGLFNSSQTVTISDATPGATIYYTTDGTTPTAASPIYAGPLPVNLSMTLQAVAVAGSQVSPDTSGSYTILTAPILQNGSFEKPRMGTASSHYKPVGGVWVFTGDSGIQSNGSIWQAPTAPDGTQVAFLQGAPAGVGPGGLGTITQRVNFTRAGIYNLTFLATRRLGQTQPLKFTLDGVQVGSLLTPPGSTFTRMNSASFTISVPGSHTLALSATDSSADQTTFVDQAYITATSLPLPPTSVAATGGLGQVKLTWTAGPLATSYTVYRGTTTGGEATTPVATGITGTTYTDTGLANGTTYYYTIAAVNSFGVSSPSAEATATTSVVILPTSEATGYSWQYTLATPSPNWYTPTFDDSTWTSGLGGFGSINFGGAVSRTTWTMADIWIRRHFTITGSVPLNQQFRVFYDEGCEIYLNGVQAATTITPNYSTTYVALPMNSAGQAALQVGDNVIAVHCHQTAGGQYIDVGIQTAP